MLKLFWARHAAAAALIVMTCYGLTACTSAPIVDTHASIAPRVLPGARGFVVCTDCDNFLPTPKHVKRPSAPMKAISEPTVPVTLSLAPHEQIVSAESAAAPAIASSITIFFPRGHARIGPLETNKLRAFLQTVRADSAFIITGYTDASGSVAANKRLAGLRAMAVKNAVMRTQHSPRVTINEAAACCSGGSNATETERAKSRRVDMEMHQ
jgi:outer membrane protein OmpA-like peptidoglycan-associated protein